MLAFGIKSLVKSACTVTVSSVVSPMRIFPPNVISPVTSKLPTMFVLDVKLIVPVPAASKYKFVLESIVRITE